MPLHIDWTNAPAGRVRGTAPQISEFSKRLGHIAGQLERSISQGTVPFLDMPFKAALEAQLPSVLGEVRAFDNMLLLGIGGSALGARALRGAFARRHYFANSAPGSGSDAFPKTGRGNLLIADNIDPAALKAWMDNIDPASACVVVVSKSGGTIETLAQYFILREWLRKSLGDGWKRHVVLITDENHGPLRREAEAEGIASLPVPDFLSGRYSVFSAVGMLPAGYLDIDWRALLEGAAEQASSLAANAENLSKSPEILAAHEAWRLALWNAELMAHGYSQLIFFSYIPGWNEFGNWFAQLWAESLGKNGKGSMPVPAVGVTDQHSLLQMFLDGPRDKGCIFVTANQDKGPAFPPDLPDKWKYLSGKQFGDLLEAEALGTRMALAKFNVPLVHINLDEADENHAGRLMSFMMLTTLLTGWLLEINPLDQPAVEYGKRLANARLGAPGLEEEKADLARFLDRQ